MRRLICLLFLLLPLGIKSNYLYTQNTYGFEKYDSYDNKVFIDNLSKDFMPDYILNYYLKLGDKDIYNAYQSVDTLNHVRSFYFFTKKANSGYLEINKKIMDFCVEMKLSPQESCIMFYINNSHVNGKKDFKRLIRLNRKNISRIDIQFDQENKFNLLVFISLN